MKNREITRSPEGGSTGGLNIGVEGAEEVLANPEPWEPWETKLVVWSIGIGLVSLAVLGTIINMTILN